MPWQDFNVTRTPVEIVDALSLEPNIVYSIWVDAGPGLVRLRESSDTPDTQTDRSILIRPLTWELFKFTLASDKIWVWAQGADTIKCVIVESVDN